MSIYFPGDESNTGSLENVTCVDVNSIDVRDDIYTQESCEVISPEMMIKQAVLKELLNQEQKINITDDKKKTRLTTPVKRKQNYTTKLYNTCEKLK